MEGGGKQTLSKSITERFKGINGRLDFGASRGIDELRLGLLSRFDGAIDLRHWKERIRKRRDPE